MVMIIRVASVYSLWVSFFFFMIASFNPHLNLMMETLLFGPSDG